MSSPDPIRPAREGAPATGTEPATVAGCLRLAAGLTQQERQVLVRMLARLDAQLARHPARDVELEVSLKGRGSPGQRLTLECWIPGRPRLVASSAQRHLDEAVRRVCEGLRRQLDDTATRREPRSNRRLRRTLTAAPAITPAITPAVAPAGAGAADGAPVPTAGRRVR
ncbi:hypothetical protein SAMN05660464_1035 [Geodermatophilus dictyosporus]|uniref:Sigma 54 modulation protein / S30EA ribosomal protein n=1 Tax=Geodermatophilus dictyosporus TaxID=1523247 RepID=A0A1I5JTW9_9ACTN|nr:hypothetical protein [Geodermatophilus dictyosporus]SFO76179.1 hypothetical protein SAMN05660464_1035 [Geodermatophilus dictyosporus]